MAQRRKLRTNQEKHRILSEATAHDHNDGESRDEERNKEATLGKGMKLTVMAARVVKARAGRGWFVYARSAPMGGRRATAPKKGSDEAIE